MITVLGEADFDADWAIASVCDGETGDILCTDSIGSHVSPFCSIIDLMDIHPFSTINFCEYLQAGDYFIWIDSYQDDENGSFSLELLCNDPEPAPECPIESNFGQRAYRDFENPTTFFSDQGISQQVADNFSSLSGDIIGMHWWGIEFNGVYEECDHLCSFDIKFFQDDSGYPGNLIDTVHVEPQKVDTGIDYADCSLYFYSSYFSEEVPITDGWVSIQACEDPEGCLFSWAGSPAGDNACMWFSGNGWESISDDTAFCVDVELPPPPIPTLNGIGMPLLLLAIVLILVKETKYK